MGMKNWDMNLKIKLFGEGFLNLAFWMMFPFLSLYFSNSFGRGTASMMLMVSQGIAVAFLLFGAYFTDKLGRRKMMLLSILGMAIGYGTFAIASSQMFYSPLLGFFGFSIVSVFSGPYYTASQAMIADIIQPKQRRYVFSVFYMLLNIAISVGPFIGSLFFHRHRFLVLSFIALACMILFVVLYRISYETAPHTTKGKKPLSLSAVRAVLKGEVRNYVAIFQDKVFLMYMIAGIFLTQTLIQLDLFIPLKVNDAIGTGSYFFGWYLNGDAWYSVLLGINGLMVVTLTVFAAKLMSRFKETTPFIYSAALYGVAFLLFGLFHHPWMYIFAIVIFSLGELSTAGAMPSFVARIAPEESRCMYFSAAQLRQSIARMIAPFSITLSAWFGSENVAFILAGICVVAFILYEVMAKLFEERIAGGKQTRRTAVKVAKHH